MTPKTRKSPESVVREIKISTRRKITAEEKIRIVLEALKGEESIAEICRREGIAPSMYYKWSKGFLEAAPSCSGITSIRSEDGRGGRRLHWDFLNKKSLLSRVIPDHQSTY